MRLILKYFILEHHPNEERNQDSEIVLVEKNFGNETFEQKDPKKGYNSFLDSIKVRFSEIHQHKNTEELKDTVNIL